MQIPLGIEGSITNSPHNNHIVKVVDDQEASGGFLIFEWWQDSKGLNSNGTFDTWVENETALTQFFAESSWVVKW